MEHVGKKVILAIAQQPFEHLGESGTSNNFATLVPLVTPAGELLEEHEFPSFGLVFWMVWTQALRFADPGRLVTGRLENAKRLDKGHQYQLAPDTVEVVSPSDLIEIIECDANAISMIRDVVNTENLLAIDHPPTPMVLLRWRTDLYGPFRAESTQENIANWLVTCRSSRTDQTVFRIPAAALEDPDTLGLSHHSISAQISFGSREPVSNSPYCNYEIIAGPACKRIPSMGFQVVSIESDHDLLLRIARRFASRKTVQQLRELLLTLGSDFDQSTTNVEAEKSIFESLRLRTESVQNELHSLGHAIIGSGLLQSEVEAAVQQRAADFIAQQSAELGADIAAKVDVLRSQLDQLILRREQLLDEIQSMQQKASEELEGKRDEFEAWKTQEEATIFELNRELDTQRDKVAAQLEDVVVRYADAGKKVVNDFLLLRPLLERFPSGDHTVPSSTQTETPPHSSYREEISYPSFVTKAREIAANLSVEDFFARFEKHTVQSGFSYRNIDLKSFHLSVISGDITILGGMSGTGKSTLPRLYAEALAGEEVTDERYLQVGVHPGWSSMQDLLGGVNSLERKFEPSESGLYRQVLYAQEEARRYQQAMGIYLITLDEMNLAHVEHYFSRFLQALESDRRVPVFDSASVALGTAFAPHGTLQVPQFMRFVGTVNFDETTRQLSLRLLDRANLIRLRPNDQMVYMPATVELRPPVAGVAITGRNLKEWVKTAPLQKDVAVLWDRVKQQMFQLGVPLTPRRYNGMLQFIASATPLLMPFQALDLQIGQRLLPQVRGTYRTDVQQGLERLRDMLAQTAYGFPETLSAIEELRRSDDGVTSLIPEA